MTDLSVLAARLFARKGEAQPAVAPTLVLVPPTEQAPALQRPQGLAGLIRRQRPAQPVFLPDGDEPWPASLAFDQPEAPVVVDETTPATLLRTVKQIKKRFQLTLRLRPETFAQLRELASQRQRTYQSLLEEAVIAYLSRETAPRAPE